MKYRKYFTTMRHLFYLSIDNNNHTETEHDKEKEKNFFENEFLSMK